METPDMHRFDRIAVQEPSLIDLDRARWLCCVSDWGLSRVRKSTDTHPKLIADEGTMSWEESPT